MSSKEYRRRYYLKNRETVLEHQKKYYQENKEVVLKRVKKYQQENKEERAAYYKRYQQENKEKRRMWRINRKARMAESGGRFTQVDIRDLYVSQGASCYYCSASIEEGYHVEHMTPISRGGTNWPDNLCLACASCNLAKYTKTAEEFAPRGENEQDVQATSRDV